MDDRTVLITGGAGYIGSHAVYAFLEAGYQVVVVDNLSTGRRENLPAGLPFELADVADGAAMDRVMRKYRPLGVLHFAGSIIVPESITAPDKYYANNTAASLRLIEACLRNDVGYFLFSSTAAVYGIPEVGMASEDTPTRPINPYGRSKLMTEQFLADVSAAYGLRYAVLRYFNVAGADPDGRCGQGGRQSTHLLKVACEVASGRRDEMPVFGQDYDTPDGTCVRDFIHVSDLARAHLMVFQRLVESGVNLVLNCGNGRGVSVGEVIHALEAIVGHPIKIKPAPRRPGDPPALVADATRLRTAIGWQARHGLDSIIRTALAWERKVAQPAQSRASLPPL
ncbi:MAG TPA: UDP-glucose 4-epimerase GalE [Magnetospirillum sp.]|nr:UDP-glucose 4-epimerase GalE [Magnetospirillum sp.]